MVNGGWTFSPFYWWNKQGSTPSLAERTFNLFQILYIAYLHPSFEAYMPPHATICRMGNMLSWIFSLHTMNPPKLATSSSIVATFWLYRGNLPPYVGLVSFVERERRGERGESACKRTSYPFQIKSLTSYRFVADSAHMSWIGLLWHV